MLVVVALGGNALLKRGEPMTAEVQRQNIRVAARRSRRSRASTGWCCPTATGRRSGCWRCRRPRTAPSSRTPSTCWGRDRGHGRLHDRAGAGQPAALRGAVRHHPDHGRGRPGRPGVPGSHQVHRPGLRAGRGGPARRREGLGLQAGRREVAPGGAVASAEAHLRDPADQWLLEKGTIVICAGGGGIPTMYAPDGTGRWSARRWSSTRTAPAASGAAAGRRPVRHGDRRRRRLPGLGQADAAAAAADDAGRAGGHRFAAGSMGPKVEAACEFVAATGRRAAIGALADIERIVAGEAGTIVEPDAA